MRRITCSMAITLLAWAGPLMAADVDAGQISKLVSQLGSDDFSQREAATKELKAIGKPALPALKEALASTDAEIATRAATLVKRIEVRPVPKPDLSARAIRMTRTRMSIANNHRVLEVTEPGRDIRIIDEEDRLVMTVTGLVEGVKATEEYIAQNADQLKAENPEAFELYEQYTTGIGSAMNLGGGVVRLNGNVMINGVAAQGVPVQQDELAQLRKRLEKQMAAAKLKEEDRAKVEDALATLTIVRAGADMDKYTTQCDDTRKVLEALKLDAGELLPPPARTRLGVSISADDNGLSVMRLNENSRGEKMGIRAGDVIQKIDGQGVSSIADLRKIVAAREKGLVVEVLRDGAVLKLEEKDEPKERNAPNDSAKPVEK